VKKSATRSRSESRQQAALKRGDYDELQTMREALISSGLFDETWYLERNTDVAAAGLDPVSHYIVVGSKEGRWPNAYFDPDYYRSHFGESETTLDHPVLHYVREGEAKGLRPVTHFDPVWYRTTYGLADDQSSLAHYLKHATTGLFGPIEEFDAGFYLSRNPDVRAAGIDPFIHYLYSGYREGRDPSPTFDNNFYTRRYLNGSGVNPLIHYLDRKDREVIQTRASPDEPVPSREIKRFTHPGVAFEELVPLRETCARRAKLLAFYLPQFHAIAENDAWWGRGFTDWTNVAKATPRFQGHYQPRIPRDLGFYDPTSPGVMRRQIELARGAGLYGFVFHFYWFNGRQLLQRPLDMLLADKSLDFPFCLHWANENWTRRWDGMDHEVLLHQDYALEDDAKLIETFVEYFHDERYVRIDGRPLLMIYRPGQIADAPKVFARWRRRFSAHGEKPIIVMAQSFGDHDPRRFGLDGAIEFPPHKLEMLPHINGDLTLFDPDFTGAVMAYDAVVDMSLAEQPPQFPLIRTVCPAWDNDARRHGAGVILHGSTPVRYEAWLTQMVGYARQHPFFGEPLVAVNAWNEWAEGAYLEPDVHFGSAYLNATARAISKIPTAGVGKIVFIGHDAHPYGAQLILLHLVRQCRQGFGMDVRVLLLGGGPLIKDFAELAQTTVIGSGGDLPNALRELSASGFRRAVINTCAAGMTVAVAKQAGFLTTLLVHELPALIEEKGLVPGARAGARDADCVVFPADVVGQRFVDLVGRPIAGRTLVWPQGVYHKTRPDPAGRQAVRRELSIADKALVVLGAGFAGPRKGFDLFLACWRTMRRKQSGAHFIWVGDVEWDISCYCRDEIETAKATGQFHLIPFQTDVVPYFAAADVFLLSSREDPFPSVVLEALQAGLPVVAFAGSGGSPELIERFGAGRVVDFGDTEAVAEAIQALRRKVAADGDKYRQHLRCIIARHFRYDDYAAGLLALGPNDYVKISVVVPNYNYAGYLPARLRSIFEQSYPVFEIIVLDDGSTDHSLPELERLARESGRDFTVVQNSANSGSVFRQWHKAIEIARGDYLWIAEADDEAAPEFLARMAAAVLADPSVRLAFCDSRVVDEDGVVLAANYKCYYEEAAPGQFAVDRSVIAREFATRYLSQRNLILNVSSTLWHRPTLRAGFDLVRKQIFDFALVGDWLLYLRTLAATDGNVAFVADPLNVHRRHQGSRTHSLDPKKHLAEVAQLHQVARDVLTLDERAIEAQASYLNEVAMQLKVAVASPSDGRFLVPGRRRGPLRFDKAAKIARPRRKRRH
jgi:glycosyltransferase involved in cell wall biosynthesis